MNIPGYPKIYNLGHRAVRELLCRPVLVQEKVDGSQFSFLVDSQSKHLVFRSKSTEVFSSDPGMFRAGVESITAIKHLLHPGWIYRGEYLRQPKHNALTYQRTPANNVILFDICVGPGDYLSPEMVQSEAYRIGLESVPNLFIGTITSEADLRQYLDRESILGGPKIEGVVVKPVTYDHRDADGHVLFGKYVSEAFKEVHTGKAKSPAFKGHLPGDIIERLGAAYGTEARWQKAIQHLRDAGQIQDSPQDIGPALNEVKRDTLDECREELKEKLLEWAWPQLARRITRDLPQWYKDQLLAKQFGGQAPDTGVCKNCGGQEVDCCGS
jgi:hypothetical protein